MGKAPSKEKITPATSGILQITGKIVKKDLKNSTVTVFVDTRASLIFIVDKNTMFSKAGKNIKLEDIKSGNIVRITYEIKEGVNIAKYIRVQEKTTSETTPASTKSKK